MDIHTVDHQRWRNIGTAFQSLLSNPVTLVGLFLSVLSVIRILEGLLNYGLRGFAQILIDQYVKIFHYPFVLLEEYFRISINDPYKDILILWITTTVVYGRAMIYLHRSYGNEIRKTAKKYGVPRSLFEQHWFSIRYNYFWFLITKPGYVRRRGEFFYYVDWHQQHPKLSWFLSGINIAYVFLNNIITNRIINEPDQKISEEYSLPSWPKRILQEAGVYLFLFPILPFMLICLAIFDDLFMVKRTLPLHSCRSIERNGREYYHYEREVNIPYDHIDLSEWPNLENAHEIIISARAFVIVQFLIIVCGIIISTF